MYFVKSIVKAKMPDKNFSSPAWLHLLKINLQTSWQDSSGLIMHLQNILLEFFIFAEQNQNFRKADAQVPA